MVPTTCGGQGQGRIKGVNRELGEGVGSEGSEHGAKGANRE